MKTVNLYGEDGICIGLTAEDDICHPTDDDCVVKVVGHRVYCESADDAGWDIRREYLRRISPERLRAQLTGTKFDRTAIQD